MPLSSTTAALDCDATRVALGEAGSKFVHSDFASRKRLVVMAEALPSAICGGYISPSTGSESAAIRSDSLVITVKPVL